MTSLYRSVLPYTTMTLFIPLTLACLSVSCTVDAPTDETNTPNSNSYSQQKETKTIRIAAAANLSSVLPTIIEGYLQDREDSASNASQFDNQVNSLDNFLDNSQVSTQVSTQIDTQDKNRETSTTLPKIDVTYASSGKLYAQIKSGAPYDIFLSANQDYPAKYAHLNTTLTSKYKPFTYAQGQLALYTTTQTDRLNQLFDSNKPLLVADTAMDSTIVENTRLGSLFESQPEQSQHSKQPIRVSIANPELAPYGASAKAFLQSLGVYNTLQDHKQLIQTENISQAFQYTHTGSTDYGFVALSQLISSKVNPKNYRLLPRSSYPPILQDGIVVKESLMAEDFANYLQSATAQQQFADAGYIPLTPNKTLP